MMIFITDDMLLAHSSPGRRQTLPNVIASLDIETPSTSSVSSAPKTSFVRPSVGGGGFGSVTKAKKSFEPAAVARKMSVPSDSVVSCCLFFLKKKLIKLLYYSEYKINYPHNY